MSYRGSTNVAQRQLNLCSGGSFLELGADGALRMIERLASNDEGWNNERDKSYRVASTSDTDQMNSMAKQIDLLTKKIEFMGMGQPGLELQEGMEDVNYVYQGGNNKNFNNCRSNQRGGNYNQYGNKVHPNLSYGNPNNALQPPPGFSVSNGMVNETKKPAMEDILIAFMNQTNKYMKNSSQRMDKVETTVQSMSTHLKSLDTRISQISQALGTLHNPGQFLGNTTINPINPKDCKAINLRSGTSYEGPSMPAEKEKPTPEEKVEEEEAEEEEKVEKVLQPEASTSILPTPVEVKIPFLHRVQKKKFDDQFSKFLDIFRKV